MYLYRDVCAFLVLVCESLHSLSSNMVKFQGYLGFFFSSSSMETWRFLWMQYSTRSAICCFLSVITEGKHSWPLKICIVYCCICKRSIMKSVWIRKVVCFVSKLFKTKGELIITFFFFLFKMYRSACEIENTVQYWYLQEDDFNLYFGHQ